MKRNWPTEDLVDAWTLLSRELELVDNKIGATRLGFAVLLKFFSLEARFPHAKNEIPPPVVVYIAKQVGVDPAEYLRYDWQGRMITYHRGQIRDFFGFREATLPDAEELTAWLGSAVLAHDQDLAHVQDLVYARYRELHVEPPTPDQVERLIRSALHTYEERFFAQIAARLSPTSQARLQQLLSATMTAGASSVEAANDPTAEDRPFWLELRRDPGRPSLDTALGEIAKLERLRHLDLPADLFAHLAPKVLAGYRQRAGAEDLSELRRHPDDIRYTLAAAYCYLRREEITDNLVDLLIGIVHAIGARAEKKVTRQLLADYRKVEHKAALFVRLSKVLIANPKGAVEDVAFPAVSEETLRNVVKEAEAQRSYQEEVQLRMRASYGNHYRRMVPRILEVLEFRSNNALHRPLIAALTLLKKYAESTVQHYPSSETVPVDGVIRPLWRPIVVGADKQGQPRLNRINYELCVLETLREQLRCKEIWVVGANRYRNPDDDLPADFDSRRPRYYAALGQPLDGETFIRDLQAQMRRELAELDRTLPKIPRCVS